MGDQALQEAIQRARQLAAKITQSAPVKRPASTSDHSGPVKVTLAYEKPANSDQSVRQTHDQTSSHRRSSSREHQRDDRDNRDSRHHRDSRDNNHNRESMRESNRNINNNTTSMLGGAHHQYQSDPMPPSRKSSEDRIEIIIPHAVIGLVIGKGGENIKRIQNESGATVRVDPQIVDEKGNKVCIITGTAQAVEEAHLAVQNVIDSAGSKRPRMATDDSDSYRMKIPASRTGAIIGKGGETIKSIKSQSGCDIELDKSAKECGPEESVFILRGSPDKIAKAKSLIEARLASRGRDGPGRDQSLDHHSSRSGPKGVATGANAAPVASYTDLPAAYPGKFCENLNNLADLISSNLNMISISQHIIRSLQIMSRFDMILQHLLPKCKIQPPDSRIPPI